MSAVIASDDGTWIPLPPPAPDAGHSTLYDPVRNRAVLIDRDGIVWTLALLGEAVWSPLTTVGSRPSGISGHSAVFDSARDRILLFGGNIDGYKNDVWSLSLSATPTWTLLQPSGTPPPVRIRHTAIYDAERDQMVVFGGLGTSLMNMNDVWALSLAGALEWTQVVPQGSPPSGRFWHEALYDPVRDRMLVVGGCSMSGEFDSSVWSLSLSDQAWSSIVTVGTPPPGRYGHSAVYDGARDRVILFGGLPGFLNDTWTLSLEHAEWSEVLPAGRLPSPRCDHSAIYDPVRDQMIVVGGVEENTVPQDTWVLALANPPTWSEMFPDGFPSTRFGHSAVYDSRRNRMVMFGGEVVSLQKYFNDVWGLALSGDPKWSELDPVGTPPRTRSGHTAIYDPVRDRLVVFGGEWSNASNGEYVNDVWELTLSSPPSWRELMPLGGAPNQRSGHTAIYDPERDAMLVFGGRNGQGGLNDTWLLSFNGDPTWSRIEPTGTVPPPRTGHGAVYDPVGDRMLVVGGSGLGDTWALTLPDMVWNAIALSGSPVTDSNRHSAIYDPLRERLVVLGSNGDEVWELALAGFPTWNTMAPVGIAPRVRGHTAIYDSERDRMVVFGFGPGEGRSHVWSLIWGDGVTSTLITLESAQVEPGVARLTWLAGGQVDVPAVVYRRTTVGSWTAIGRASTDGASRLVYEDTEVQAGTRYCYRLGFVHDGVESFLGEAWLDVPMELGFALAGLRPNPSSEGLRVAFSLPDASAASLELLDLSGRRLLVREVGSLGPGSHLVELGHGGRPAPGVYYLRLFRGGRALSVRAIVLR